MSTLAGLSTNPWIRLFRLDRPIGTYLLLWPTLWALWLASNGFPEIDILLIFFVGVIVTRAAGCVINDYADRNIDGQISRTANRPIATGEIKPHSALLACVFLLVLAFCLVIQTNYFTVVLSMVAVVLMTIYPFCKRWINFPQVLLGLTWGREGPMSFAAVGHNISFVAFALYLSVVFWTIAFDTLYAMVDREDDIRVGVKSTAVYWAGNELRHIALCQLCSLILLAYCGHQSGRGWAFGAGIAITAICFVRQLRLANSREKSDCLNSFMNNHWVGMCIFLFLVLDYCMID